MKTDQLLSEATRCVADVQFVPSGPSPAAPRIDPSQFNGSDGNDGIRSSSLDGSNNNYNTTTPIYASHATTAPSLSSPPGSGPNQSLEGDNNNMGTLHSQFSTEGIHDAAADEWGKSTGAAVVGAGALASPDREGPISFPEPSRSQGVSSYDHAAGSDPSQQRRQSGDSRAYEGASDPIGHYGGRADMLETEQRQGGEPSSAYEVHPSRDGVTLSDDPPASYAADPPAAAAAAAAAASVAAEDIPRLATPPLSSPNKSTDAPLLPALRSSSPLPQPAPAVSADDDVSYFQGVGATHAMRNAVRRPSSPSAGAPRLPSGSYSGTSALSPPSGAYEPPAEGRKMTAAAFRRGFNRAPSAQNMGASPSTEHPPAGVFGGAGGDGSVTPHPPGALPPPTEYDSAGNVKPLHIRKRLSGASGPDRTMSGDSFGTAAPPYGQGPAEGSYAVPPAPYGAPQPGSGYGGPSAHGALPAPPAQYHDPWQQQQQQQEGGAGNGFGGIGGGPVHPPPPQPWAQGYGSRPGSRPGSAGGQRGNESSGPGAPPPGYGPPYAAGPQQWH